MSKKNGSKKNTTVETETTTETTTETAKVKKPRKPRGNSLVILENKREKLENTLIKTQNRLKAIAKLEQKIDSLVKKNVKVTPVPCKLCGKTPNAVINENDDFAVGCSHHGDFIIAVHIDTYGMDDNELNQAEAESIRLWNQLNS